MGGIEGSTNVEVRNTNRKSAVKVGCGTINGVIFKNTISLYHEDQKNKV
jgi:hypothetical protein